MHIYHGPLRANKTPVLPLSCTALSETDSDFDVTSFYLDLFKICFCLNYTNGKARIVEYYGAKNDHFEDRL